MDVVGLVGDAVDDGNRVFEIFRIAEEKVIQIANVKVTFVVK